MSAEVLDEGQVSVCSILYKFPQLIAANHSQEQRRTYMPARPTTFNGL